MGTTIAVINQKGGVGKTTTAAALIAGLTSRGYRCLGIDLDAQCNLSYTMEAATGGASIIGVLLGECSALDAIQTTDTGDIIAASTSLAGADATITETGKEYRLKEALETIKAARPGEYDYIIIDTPPALGVLTVNALTASNSVIIPAQADIFSLQGIEQLGATIAIVRKYCNESLEIAGILLTRYNSRALLSREVANNMNDIAASMGTKVFSSTIREGIAVKESQVNQQSLFSYAARALVTQDYSEFIGELLGEMS